MTTPFKTISERFFNDPEWEVVEEMILRHIEPLKDFNTIDLKQPAEHVKAEIIGRMHAYNALSKFLSDTKIVNKEMKPYQNPFK